MPTSLKDFNSKHHLSKANKVNLSTPDGLAIACHAMSELSPSAFKIFLHNAIEKLDITAPFGEGTILSHAYRTGFLIEILSSAKTAGDIDLGTPRGQTIAKLAMTKQVLGAFLDLPRVKGKLDMNAVIQGRSLKDWSFETAQTTSLYCSIKVIGGGWETIDLSSPEGLGMLWIAATEGLAVQFIASSKVIGTVDINAKAPEGSSPILETLKYPGQFELLAASGKLIGKINLLRGVARDGLPIQDGLAIDLVKAALKTGQFQALDPFLEGTVNLNFLEEGEPLVSFAKDDVTLAAFLSSKHVIGTLDINTKTSADEAPVHIALVPEDKGVGGDFIEEEDPVFAPPVVEKTPIIDHPSEALRGIYKPLLAAKRIAVTFKGNQKDELHAKLNELDPKLIFTVRKAEYLTNAGKPYLFAPLPREYAQQIANKSQVLEDYPVPEHKEGPYIHHGVHKIYMQEGGWVPQKYAFNMLPVHYHSIKGFKDTVDTFEQVIRAVTEQDGIDLDGHTRYEAHFYHEDLPMAALVQQTIEVDVTGLVDAMRNMSAAHGDFGQNS